MIKKAGTFVKPLRTGADDPVVTHERRTPTTGPRTAQRIASSAAAFVLTVLAGILAVAPAGTASAVSDHDWLGVVNTYRAMSGLAPVTANATWSAQAQNHSCYMLQNGISHDEIPGRPGYTEGGDIAGNSGNVAVSSSISTTPRQHIELWMTGPFHAIGILRHSLAQSGFGLCAAESTPTPWRSGGTLDVIRGIDYGRGRPSTPIVFPGNGATVPLHSFITEYPNPMTYCGWTGSAGLPLIAMMPSGVSSASSTLTGPSGPIQTCTLHKSNTDGTARAILDGDNAVVVMPRTPLVDGTYTATVNSNGGNATWSFTVDRSAPLSATPPPAAEGTAPAGDLGTFEPVSPFRLVDSRNGHGAVRLQGGQITRIPVSDSSAVAVSANFVSVSPAYHGFITAFNCTTNRPTVSTLNYRPGETVANHAIVPLQSGAMCLYSLVSTDVVIDVNGYYRGGSGRAGFVAIPPVRLADTRSGTRLAPGEVRALTVGGSSRAVALNITVSGADGAGYLSAFPCGAPNSSEISTINFDASETRPNSAVVPVDAKGQICVRSVVGVDLIVDMTGYFVDGDGRRFQALNPIRVFDSRLGHSDLNRSTNGNRVRSGQVIRLQISGTQGVPSGATAVSANVTATEALAHSYLTVYPCGVVPPTSNVNISPAQNAVANGAMVQLSGSGELCIYAKADVHVVVDVNGVWL